MKDEIRITQERMEDKTEVTRHEFQTQLKLRLGPSVGEEQETLQM
jgi:hypothetical protein